ncbi:MAG: hypothetical protein JWO78_895 [Micavibrio sp.]|nr:hypothetical protein [Micavibrio sp.]
MSTIRQTRDTFNDLIDKLKTVRQGFNAEAAAIEKEIRNSRRDVRNAVGQIVPETSPRFMAWLDEMSEKTNVGRNFTLMVAGLNDQDETLRTEIGNRQAGWSSPTADMAEYERLQTTLRGMRDEETSTQADIRNIKAVRESVEIHNMEYPHAPLNEETIPAFKELSRWKYMTDSAYRSGYTALRDYPSVHGSFEKDITELSRLSTQNSKQRTDISLQDKAAAALDRKITGMNDLEKDIARLQSKIVGPEKILDTVQETVANLVEKNPAFARLVAEESGLELAGPMDIALLKIQKLQRAEQGIKAHNNGINKTLGKLEAPISKLNRGVSNGGGSTTVKRLDLDSIKKSVTGQIAGAKTENANASSYRSTVSNFSPSYQSSNDFSFFQNLLLIDLLTHHHDHSYCYSTLGVRENSVPVTLEGLDQLRESQTVGLQGVFNTAASNVDTSGIDVPDLKADFDMKIDVPNVDVQVDVPDIKVDVPEIQVDLPDFNIEVFNTPVDIPDCGSVSFDP